MMLIKPKRSGKVTNKCHKRGVKFTLISIVIETSNNLNDMA